ncbi:RICIN domain-containing protein [Streptomyces parvulus]|uniref:RICIN domain-containing protein n=1 Tax=Streptomyces parvulus TaxID=146923 RepID=UPI00341BA39E
MAAGSDGPGTGSRTDYDPPGNRPKKPMLAAASIAGALLIAVPLLVAGQDEREPERTETKNAAGTVLESEPSDIPVVYSTESPHSSVGQEEKKEESKGVGTPSLRKQALGSPPPTMLMPQKRLQAKVEPRKSPEALKKESSAPTPRELGNALSARVNAQIKSAETGKCADLPYFGKGKVDGPIRQFDCRPTTGDNQLWDLKVVDTDGGPGGASLFVIKNRKDGLCFDLPYYGAPAHGTKINQYPCNGTSADNQRWWLDPHPGGMWIRNATNNRCMAVDGGRAAGDDARLKVTDCGDTAQSAQRWVIASVG